MLTYGAVVAGGLGFWRYEMIRRERAARIAAENRAIAIQQQAEAERRLAEAERQQAAEERQQAAEERRQAAANLRQAAEERLRLIDTINELVTQQRNGNHGSNTHSPNEQ